MHLKAGPLLHSFLATASISSFVERLHSFACHTFVVHFTHSLPAFSFVVTGSHIQYFRTSRLSFTSKRRSIEMLAVAVLSALAAFTSLPAVEGVAVRGLGVIQERAEVEGHSLGSCKAPLLTYHIAAKHTFGLAFPDGYDLSLLLTHGHQSHTN